MIDWCWWCLRNKIHKNDESALEYFTPILSNCYNEGRYFCCCGGCWLPNKANVTEMASVARHSIQSGYYHSISIEWWHWSVQQIILKQQVALLDRVSLWRVGSWNVSNWSSTNVSHHSHSLFKTLVERRWGRFSERVPKWCPYYSHVVTLCFFIFHFSFVSTVPSPS